MLVEVSDNLLVIISHLDIVSRDRKVAHSLLDLPSTSFVRSLHEYADGKSPPASSSPYNASGRGRRRRGRAWDLNTCARARVFLDGYDMASCEN